MIFTQPVDNQLFGTGNAVIESSLKNPNQYRDAVLYESLSSLSKEKINEFVKSKEAEVMLNEGLISADVLERLAREHDDGILNTTVCHMAKENGDPLWDEFVRLRIEERRLMNELLDKYSNEAKPVADNAQTDFVENCIPKYFR